MGVPSRGEVYEKLIEHLRNAQECSAIMGHLHNTETSDKDKKLAAGWLMIAEMLRKTQHQVTIMAQGRMQ